jgi:hypothetical protein
MQSDEEAPELEDHYRALLASVPELADGQKEFRFDRTSIRRPPPKCWTTNLAVDVTKHSYSNAFEPELLTLPLGRVTCGSLGCLVLASLIHRARASVELRNQARIQGRGAPRARWLVIDPGDVREGDLEILDLAFTYWPREQLRHPIGQNSIHFEFADKDENRCVTVEHRAERDHVFVGGVRTRRAGTTRARRRPSRCRRERVQLGAHHRKRWAVRG